MEYPYYDMDNLARVDDRAKMARTTVNEPYSANNPKVLVSNRGRTAALSMTCIQRYPTTRLAQDTAHIWQGQTQEDTLRLEYCRNMDLFDAIVDFYIGGELHFPHSICFHLYEQELEFWGIHPECISPCCRGRYREAGSVKRTVQWLRKDWEKHMCIDLDDFSEIGSHDLSCLRRMWFFFEDPESSLFAKAWSIFSTLLLLSSLVSLTVQSLPSIREFGRDDSTNKSDYNASAGQRSDGSVSPYAALIYADVPICSLLLAEYILRFICCPMKLNFVKSMKNVFCMLSIVPSIVDGLIFYFHGTIFQGVSKPFLGWVMNVFFRMRVLRIIGLARYDQYFPIMRIIFLTVRASFRQICLVIIILLAFALFFGALLFYVEIGEVASIPLGMWWAAVTMTTLGYGDVYPTSPLGCLVAVACVLTGIVILVLPIPIVSKRFAVFTQAMAEFVKMKEEAREGTRHVAELRTQGFSSGSEGLQPILSSSHDDEKGQHRKGSYDSF